MSGAGAGSIQIKGDSISLNNGSLLLIQNQGLQKAGDIDINAAESLEINGISADGTIRSAIVNETLAGNSGNINVVTRRLIVKDGGSIGNRTFSPAQGGNISLNFIGCYLLGVYNGRWITWVWGWLRNRLRVRCLLYCLFR